MKKYFMIAAAALLIASCAKESDEMYEGIAQSNEITFSAFAKNAVKGYVTANELYEWNFKDLRDASGNVASSDASSDPASIVRDMQLSVFNASADCDLFVGETYTKGKDDKYWHATPRKFYPIGYGDFYFLAYSTSASADAGMAPAAAWNGARKVTLEVTDKSLENDILYAGGKQNAKAQAPAYMLFKHAQAWITVRFTADYGSGDASCLNASGDPVDASGNAILKIDEAVWQNIYKSGELTLEWKDGKPEETVATDNHKADATATWNFFTQETSNVAMPDRCDKTYKSGDASADAATYGYPVATEAKLVKNSYLDMLIPEQAKQALVINYTLGGKQFSYTVDLDKIKGTSGNDWKMGQHYIYNIKFYVTEITTSPSVVVWEKQDEFNPNPLPL